MIENNYDFLSKDQMISINYFLIRELYRLVCVHENMGSMPQFYFYLLGDSENYTSKENQDNISKKCQNRFNKFLENGEGDMTLAKNKLVHIGIPVEYFEGKLFDMSDEIEKQVVNFVAPPPNLKKDQNSEKNEKKGEKFFPKLQKLLKDNYEDVTIEIEDQEIPVIAFMAELYRRIIQFDKVYKDVSKDDKPLTIIPNLNFLILEEAEREKNSQTEKANTIMASQIKKNLGMKEIKGLYLYIIKDGYIDSNYIEEIKESSTRNIYTNKTPNDITKYNFFLIREVYKLLADMDGIKNAVQKFYNYLEITEADYERIIETGIADNRYLYDKMAPFQFPVSMFRGDNPVIIKMNSNLKYKLEEYFRKVEIAERELNNRKINAKEYAEKKREYQGDFWYFLKFEICYLYHTDNFILFFAVARMLQAIKDHN